MMSAAAATRQAGRVVMMSAAVVRVGRVPRARVGRVVMMSAAAATRQAGRVVMMSAAVVRVGRVPTARVGRVVMMSAAAATRQAGRVVMMSAAVVRVGRVPTARVGRVVMMSAAAATRQAGRVVMMSAAVVRVGRVPMARVGRGAMMSAAAATRQAGRVVMMSAAVVRVGRVPMARVDRGRGDERSGGYSAGRPRRDDARPDAARRQYRDDEGRPGSRPERAKRAGQPEPRRSGTRGLRGDGRSAPPEAGPRSWGGLARRGAARINEGDVDSELEPEYTAPDRDKDPIGFAKHEEREARHAKSVANRERLRNEAVAAIGRAKPAPVPARKGRVSPPPRERRPLTPRPLPDPKKQLQQLLGTSGGSHAWRDLKLAAEHIAEGRAGQARVIAEGLFKRAPEVVEVAETYGLALYGQGRWREAIEVLEELRDSTGLPDQNPVLADAHRAIGNFADVEVLWDELSEASPSSGIVTEGRIVASGALADQGRIADAVRLLSKGWKRPKRPMEHHLRRAYALADLYERAEEVAQAKELFGWIAHHEPRYLDAKQRSR